MKKINELPVATAAASTDKFVIETSSGTKQVSKENVDKNLVKIQSTQPTETDNRIWVDTSSSGTIELATEDEVAELKRDIEQKSGLTEDVKIALLNCLKNVAWATDSGQSFYDALYDVLYPDTGLVRITAAFNQEDLVVTPSTPLDTLKAYLTVTGYYDDGTAKQITAYALSGTLDLGTSTVTVTYEEKTATFTVNVTALPGGYTACDYIKAGSTEKNANEIVTEYYFNSNTIAISKAKLHISSATGTNNAAAIMTDHSASGYSVSLNLGGGGTRYRIRSYRGGTRYDSNLFEDGQFDLDAVHDFVIWENNAVVVDENTVLENVVDAGGTSGLPMCIFGDSHDSSELYSLTIYENNVVMADYMPCTRNSDGMVGVYDTISEKFYGNANLIAGQNA